MTKRLLREREACGYFGVGFPLIGLFKYAAMDQRGVKRSTQLKIEKIDLLANLSVWRSGARRRVVSYTMSVI